MILTVLLTILKIAGIILLCILAVFLFVFLCLLFVPFGYKIDAEKNESISGRAAVSWLFGIIKIVYEYKDAAGQPSVKLIGITVWREKQTETEKKQVTAETENHTNKTDRVDDINKVNIDKSDAVSAITEEAKSASCKDSQPSSVLEQTVAQKQAESGENPQAEPRTPLENIPVEERDESVSESKPESKMENKPKSKSEKKEKSIKNKKPKSDSSKEKSSPFEALKKLSEYENKREILKQALLLIKRLLKIITSFKLKARLIIGTGQPDTTGGVIGLFWAAAGITGADIRAEGDFEKQTFLGSVAVKGRIFICSIVWAILMFILNKNIFPIVKKLIFKRG